MPTAKKKTEPKKKAAPRGTVKTTSTAPPVPAPAPEPKVKPEVTIVPPVVKDVALNRRAGLIAGSK